MKKNVMMRAASALGVAVLLSTCVISGTFAKYTTSATGSDTARVAKWGFESAAELTITDLFTHGDTDVTSANTDKVIAPGTKHSVDFWFEYDKTSNNIAAPEVDYTFEVTASLVCSDEANNLIKNNPSITWSLDGTTGMTWDQLINAIQALDGNATNNRYEAGSLPEAFYGTTDAPLTKHTIGWEWAFENTTSEESKKEQDGKDTMMGNLDVLQTVTITITITATQVNDVPATPAP